MTSQLAFFSLDIIAAFCALLFSALMLVARQKEPSARLVALIALNLVCGVLLTRQELAYWIPDAYRIDVGVLRLPFHILRNTTPGVLAVLCFSLFEDQGRFPRWLIAIFAVQVAAEALMPWAGSGPASQYSSIRLIPALLELPLMGSAFYWLVSGWQSDLVESRRRLRFLFLVLVALDVIVVLLAERLIIPWGSIAIYYAHLTESAINLALILTAICAMVLIGRPALVDPFGDRKVVVIPPADKQATRKPDPAVASILRALREQRVYRDCELTVASLAAKLSMPQYRLRKVILEELGYRNFNALLHEYRLAEACQDLRDPAKTHVPILTIALTVGYASINPFNRAFRDALGMTPSAYRAQESAAIPTDS